MEKKKEKVYRAGDRVKMTGKGEIMKKTAIEEMGLKVGDMVMCIDPDSKSELLSEKGWHWTVYKQKVRRIARKGIRTERTSHDFLREDGLWSYAEDEKVEK